MCSDEDMLFRVDYLYYIKILIDLQEKWSIKYLLLS